MMATDEQIRNAIAERAGDWFIANQTGRLSAVDRAAFVEWLRASPVHVGEYLHIAEIARELPAATAALNMPVDTLIAQARDDHEVAALERATPTPASPSRRHRALRQWTVAASAVCAVIVFATAALWQIHDGELLGLPKTYQTAHGEQRATVLPDGSLLRINSDSSVTVHYSGAERVVDIDRGQALFRVVHEGGRGFVVRAGNTKISAVGTEFDVFRRHSTTLVTVVAGTVAVLASGAAPHRNGSAAQLREQRVLAGYQLRIDAGVAAAQPTKVDVQQTEAWVRHRIVFEQRPLGEVAEEFNRYSRVPLIFADAGLRALPVSGAFDAFDIDSFATFLSTLDGVKVEKTPTQIRVTKVTPTESKPVAISP